MCKTVVSQLHICAEVLSLSVSDITCRMSTTSILRAHDRNHLRVRLPMQGQSSKRVVTVSHEGHAGNGMAAKNPRFEFDSPEPGEMRMPLQMAPVPVHMHPRAPQPDQFPLLQDPSQGAPFLQDRPEDPRYLPRQDPVMEWFHPESMSMASLPQPWHVHEMQMSGHRGHPVEMQAQQRFGPPDGRLPHQTEERQQSMQNMHLPPMPHAHAARRAHVQQPGSLPPALLEG